MQLRRISACQNFARAHAVFVAEVLDVTESAALSTLKIASMRVMRSYKGDAATGQTITVRTFRGTSANCSIDFCCR